MPNESNADSPERRSVAENLYRERGPQEASSRCDANTKFAAVDLCDEILTRLALQPGETVLDVACGSGQHLQRFAEVVGQGGSALGFDFSMGAIEKTVARGCNAEVADGASLPVTDAFADALACSFAIYYFPDLDAGLREWQRVLKPGGRIVLSGPADDTNAELYEFHRAVTGQGPADVDKLSLGYVASRLPSAMEALGYHDVQVNTFTNPITFPDADAFVDYWTQTSLFARGVDKGDRDATIEKGHAKLTRGTARFAITKRVAICSARR